MELPRFSKNIIINCQHSGELRLVQFGFKIVSKSLGISLLLFKASKKELKMKRFWEALKTAFMKAIIKNKKIIVFLTFDLYMLETSSNVD